jgi:nitrite reductase (NADH) small subunit/3-phenylpropionate/trans-cinnamate dioxygenase ferredoxin subunit
LSEVRAAALADLVPDRPISVTLNGTRVALVRIGEQVHAIGDDCRHQGGPLGEGNLRGTRLACPWHGWMYDVRTGQCLFPARGGAVPSYPVRIADGDVWVDLP